MISAIKAEFRKLLTIRSTYIVSGLSLLLISAITFYFIGIKADGVFDAGGVQQAVLDMVAVVGILVGVTAILSICHEYRYNTISYTLTTTNRRLKVLAAKLVVIGAYAVVMTLLAVILTAIFTPLGVSLGNATVAPQDFALWDTLWRTVAYMIGGAWLGLLLGFLFRSLVFSITIYFVLPTTVEPILINLLKVDRNWLPNTAQSQIVSSGGGTPDALSAFSPLASAGVLALYLVVGWIIASVLFVRRDAS